MQSTGGRHVGAIVCSAGDLDPQVDRRVDVQAAALERLLALLGGRAEGRIVLDDVLTYWQKYAQPPAAPQPVVGWRDRRG